MEFVHFENEMLILKADISKLLSLVLESFEMSIKSIEDMDEKLAMRIIKLDNSIDDVNRRVEESVYQIIARFNPLGKDLRYAITMIKFSNNLERIGDLSVNIARKVLTMHQDNSHIILPTDMKKMFGITRQMIKDAFTAFGEKNIKKAVEVWNTDTEIDILEKNVDNYVLENFENPQFDKKLIPIFILIARDIERIADHVTNLCEEIVYIETGNEINEIEEEE